MRKAVFWSEQYITTKQLPDIAIDLIDEAEAARKFSVEAMPASIVALEADIRAKLTLAKTDKADPAMVGEITSLQAKLAEQKKAWEEKVIKLKKVGELRLRLELERSKFELEKAQKSGHYQEASKINYSKIPELEKHIVSLDISQELTREDVADVLSRHTCIAVKNSLK